MDLLWKLLNMIGQGLVAAANALRETLGGLNPL